MTMNTVLKKIVCGVLSLAISAGSLFTGANCGFTKTGGSTVITASAAIMTYKPGMRSGRHTCYVSKVGITSNALTICGNCDDDVDFLLGWLDKMNTACSAGKSASNVIKAFGGDSTILTVFKKIFSSIGGFGSSAGKARKELVTLTNKYKLQGFKVTLRQDGDWIVETQAKDSDLEKAYKDYVNSMSRKTDKIADGCIYSISPIANTGINISIASNANKSNVKLATSNAKDSKQQWKVVVESNGYIRLQNVYSKKYLDVAINNTSSCANGKNIHLYSRQSDKNTSKTQMFAYKLMKNGNTTYYKLTLYNTKYSVDAASDAPKNGSNLQTWKWLGNTTQQWVFKRIK